MREEVYDYLHDYGFSAIELDKIEKTNENMFFTDISEVRKNITFLEEKLLDNEEVLDIINKNPFMLTEKNNRLEQLDNIYLKELVLSDEDLINLLLNNPETYTLSPVELQKIIDYLKNKNCTFEVIRDLILKNPKVISMKFEDFEKAIKFN